MAYAAFWCDASAPSSIFTAKLEPGNHALICNLAEPEGGMTEHHYALGMRSAFKVK